MIPDPSLIANVKGFLDEEEGAALYRLALEASTRGACLEIGSYCGKSALYLGAGCRQRHGVLFTLDHHRGSEEQQPGQEYFDPELFDPAIGEVNTLPLLRRTLALAGLEDTVVPLVCRSAVAARLWATPLSLVFIDGGHAYDTVLADYTLWSGHLIAGGYLLFHDIFIDPAKGGQAPRQVFQAALASGLYLEKPMVKTLGILQRLPCVPTP